MKNLFALFLLAAAFLAPSSAWAVNCFWVGGTGTWDNSSTTHWAPTSGGAATGCQTTNAAPAAGDAITFDANSGGGTVTAAANIASIAFLSLTVGSITLDFSVNNPNMAFTSFVEFGGSTTRNINTGSGTWTLSGTTSNPAEFNCTSTTGLTQTFTNSTWVYSGSSVFRVFNGASGLSMGPLVINNNSTKGFVRFTGATTFASITVGSGNTLTFPQGITTTVTGALNITGTSSAPSGIQSDGPQTNVTTVSVGSASSVDWAAFLRVTRSGAGSMTATNSFDLGGNTGVTISGPSGGSGGGRIIGG